jgi:hypothetical protein
MASVPLWQEVSVWLDDVEDASGDTAVGRALVAMIRSTDRPMPETPHHDGHGDGGYGYGDGCGYDGDGDGYGDGYGCGYGGDGDGDGDGD